MGIQYPNHIRYDDATIDGSTACVLWKMADRRTGNVNLDRRMMKDSVERWGTQDSSDLYDVERWGKGYFSISKAGTVLVHPNRDPKRSIDMKELVDRLQMRGMDLPILFRFNGILRDRLHEIAAAFARAIEDHNYQGKYTCVYPIKVNQQRQVVEKIVE